MRAGGAALVALALLGACSRGLTPAETGMARALFGETLDAGAVRVLSGVGLTPLAQPAAPQAATAARKPPQNLCLRTQAPRRRLAWPAAFTLGNAIFFNDRLYLPDAAQGFPDAVPFPASILLLHELVHVWQWQNRAQTGYTIRRTISESVVRIDPYWWLPEADRSFAQFGFEQQAAIVEDFACHALFDRRNPRLAELTAMLRPVLPVDRFLAALDAAP